MLGSLPSSKPIGSVIFLQIEIVNRVLTHATEKDAEIASWFRARPALKVGLAIRDVVRLS